MKAQTVIVSDVLSASLRACGYVSSLQAAGATIFLPIFGSGLRNSIGAVLAEWVLSVAALAATAAMTSSLSPIS